MCGSGTGFQLRSTALAVLLSSVVVFAGDQVGKAGGARPVSSAKGPAIELELRDQLTRWGFSPAFADRFLRSAQVWNLHGVAVHLDFLDRAGVTAQDREQFTKLVRQLPPPIVGPPSPAGPGSPLATQTHLSDARIRDAIFSAPGSPFDCRPYLTAIRVTANDPLQLQAPTAYGASGFPQDGSDFLALGSGDVFTPRKAGDLDVPPTGIDCNGDNIAVTFEFNNDLPSGGPIEVQSIKFDFIGFTYEFPEFVGFGFNDFVFAYLDTPDPILLDPLTCVAPIIPTTGCLITLDAFGNPTNVDSAFYSTCDVQACDSPPGDPGWSLEFLAVPGDAAGSTGRLEACTPLSPTCTVPATAGTHTVTLIVGDAGDGIFTTVGLFDNLRCYSDLQCTGPIVNNLAVVFNRVEANWSRDDSSVVVLWDTLVEEGTVAFAVERGPAKEGPFAIVTTVAATGAGRYQVIDPAPSAARSAWYRIVEYTVDGPGDRTDPFRLQGHRAGRQPRPAQ